MITTPKNERGHEGASIPARKSETADPEVLGRNEAVRLLQPTMELISQAGPWDSVTKKFALGIAVWRLLDENVSELQARAQALIDESRKKKD